MIDICVGSFYKTGVLLIPEKMCVEQPITINHTIKRKKLLLTLQADSSVTIYENSGLIDLEIHVQSGAQLFCHTTVIDTSEKNITVVLEGEGARASITCTYLLNAHQSFNIKTCQEHRACNSESSVVLRGALTDQASIVHKGMVFVPKNVTGVCARQNNKAILLSCGSRIDSSPELEVLNQNVQCSHGSAVGQLDKEQLLYLRSRGLPEGRARRLLLEAFLTPSSLRLCRAGLPTDERKAKKGFERLITKLREMV